MEDDGSIVQERVLPMGLGIRVASSRSKDPSRSPAVRGYPTETPRIDQVKIVLVSDVASEILKDNGVASSEFYEFPSDMVQRGDVGDSGNHGWLPAECL